MLTMWFKMNTCFLYGVWNLGNKSVRQCYMSTWMTPVKTQAFKPAWDNFPDWQHYVWLSHIVTGEIKWVQCGSIGRGYLKLWAQFPLKMPHMIFSFPTFTLYSFTEINHNHGYNNFWVLYRSPSEPLSLRMILGTPHISVYWEYLYKK